MNAPLSLFLTRFTPPPVSAAALALASEPPQEFVTLPAADLAARLEAVAAAARAEAEQIHAAESAAAAAAHEAALAQALDAARAEWLASQAESLTTGIEQAIADLRTALADRIAAVLRPLLVDGVLARATSSLADALDRLLADPKAPMLRVSGPRDLLAALRAARPTVGIEWIETQTIDVTIVAEGTRIESRLEAALDTIMATEA